MSLQSPIIVVSAGEPPAFADVLERAPFFPIIETDWAEVSRAVTQMDPAAVLVTKEERAIPELAALAAQIGGMQPYLPLIAIDPTTALPENAIPFSQGSTSWDRLVPRLRACLRVRTLHTTIVRRLNDRTTVEPQIAASNPAREATVLLIGRGGVYPALSVALGERMGVIGAFSIEAAAKHLNSRDIDGIVIGEGFSPRVVDAFLTVLAEDSRFRHLPVTVTLDGWVPSYDLPNLEIICGEPAHIAANALPLIGLHAFEVHLSRTLRSIDANGLLDPRTGLLTPEAFDRDLVSAISQTLASGGGLSVARFAFDPALERAQLDGARLLSRLMRQMDFGALRPDGSAIVVLADTDSRTARSVARRLSSVMRHTASDRRDVGSEPDVSVTSLQASDTAKSLLARLYDESRRAAS